MKELEFWDAHCHINDEKDLNKSLKFVLKEMDKAGILKACISTFLGFTAKNVKELKKGNKNTLSIIKRYPDRFRGACQVNPFYKEESLIEMEN
ncbi:MAG: hypothetical protein ABIE74_09005, partial [Pseudomonadota bacterium]